MQCLLGLWLGVYTIPPARERKMSSTAAHPSISSTPIELNGSDLATACVLCSHNCGLRVDVSDGRITDVRADETNPFTQGYICNKGVTITNYIDHTGTRRSPRSPAA